jgi:predicted RNase H-like nuclease
MTSVFSPPSRAALEFAEYGKACEMNWGLTGRKISKQAFGIAPKIREVAGAMCPALESRVFEAHPEAAFAVVAERAMRHRKSTREGRAERWAVLRRILGDLPASPALPDSLRGYCHIEDYADALVCAWTAARIAAGKAVSMPEEPPRDANGLRMAIWRPA